MKFDIVIEFELVVCVCVFNALIKQRLCFIEINNNYTQAHKQAHTHKQSPTHLSISFHLI